jgi:tRNA 2-thiouridine synthesizing protein A
VSGLASVVEVLDLVGEVCPYTFVRAKLRLEELALGARLELLVDHPAAVDNVPRSLRAEGQEVVAVTSEPGGGRWRIAVVKRAEPARRR